MSDFKSNPLASTLAKLQAAQDELAKLKPLADALDPTVMAPTSLQPFGYCTELGMTFDLTSEPEESRAELLSSLLKAYPPVPLVDLTHVRAQKPKVCLRGSEFDEPQTELYPVLFQFAPKKAERLKDVQGEATARWWTELSVGLVHVSARGASQAHVTLPPGAYAPDTHSYATGHQSMFHRCLKQFDGGSLADVWDAPAAKLSAQLPNDVARNCLSLLVKRIALGQAMPSLADVEEARMGGRRGWPAPTGGYFSEDDAKKMLEVLTEMFKAHPALVTGQAELLERAQAWLTSKLSAHSGVAADVRTREALRQALQLAVQGAVSVQWVSSAANGNLEVQIAIPNKFTDNRAFRRFEVTPEKSAPPLTYRDLDEQYVETPA